MTKIIGNCVSILVLSSALPVMSRTLGITRFDLLGDFGRFNWLGNFYIVLSYNLLFAIVTTLCLVRKFTSAVREELFKALGLHKLHLSDTPRDSDTAKPSANGHQKALWGRSATLQSGASTPHSRHSRQPGRPAGRGPRVGPGPVRVPVFTVWGRGCRRSSPLCLPLGGPCRFQPSAGSSVQRIFWGTCLLASAVQPWECEKRRLWGFLRIHLNLII